MGTCGLLDSSNSNITARLSHRTSPDSGKPAPSLASSSGKPMSSWSSVLGRGTSNLSRSTGEPADGAATPAMRPSCPTLEEASSHAEQSGARSSLQASERSTGIAGMQAGAAPPPPSSSRFPWLRARTQPKAPVRLLDGSNKIEGLSPTLELAATGV
jgi:hypothetical protein